jgi:hypothetical protein
MLKVLVPQPLVRRARDPRVRDRAEVLDAPEAGAVVSTADLTPAEQTLVRTALRFLRARCGTWAVVGKALRFSESGMTNIVRGQRSVSPTVAFRVARLAKVSVDDVLTGRFPAPGTCAHCGHVREEA